MNSPYRNRDSTPVVGHDGDPSKQAVIYLRVSTREQAERDGDPEGYSLPAQREACLRKAKSLEVIVVEEFVDRGESAKTADGPKLHGLRIYVAQHPSAYVIVHKVDRLPRNRVDGRSPAAGFGRSLPPGTL